MFYYRVSEASTGFTVTALGAEVLRGSHHQNPMDFCELEPPFDPDQ